LHESYALDQKIFFYTVCLMVDDTCNSSFLPTLDPIILEARLEYGYYIGLIYVALIVTEGISFHL